MKLSAKWVGLDGSVGSPRRTHARAATMNVARAGMFYSDAHLRQTVEELQSEVQIAAVADGEFTGNGLNRYKGHILRSKSLPCLFHFVVVVVVVFIGERGLPSNFTTSFKATLPVSFFLST